MLWRRGEWRTEDRLISKVAESSRRRRCLLVGVSRRGAGLVGLGADGHLKKFYDEFESLFKISIRLKIIQFKPYLFKISTCQQGLQVLDVTCSLSNGLYLEKSLFNENK